MMKMKLISVLGLVVLLNACSSSTYNIKSEKGNIVNKVPNWYMADFNDKEHCDLSMWTKKDNDKVCVYGVATAVSPDLDLAIEKAKMKAKAEIADIIKGEMNKESKQFITELGKSETKTVVTDVESTLVNIIKNTKVRGYEVFEQDVTLTKSGYYRAWIGLRLPMGKFNKMYHYSIEEALDSFKLNEASKEAWKNVKENSNDNSSL